MRKLLFVLTTVLALSPCLAPAITTVKAPDLTTPDQNSSISFNYDDANSFSIRYPRTIDWIVDGHRILVYPSSPSIHINVGHIHPGSHVAANQMHIQGPYLKDAKDWGPVSEGIVYTVDGGPSGSGVSRLVEKVDVLNKTGSPLTVPVVGMGWTPQPAVQANQAGLEIPDFTGVTGVTVAFIQGNAQTTSITEPPFTSVTVIPAASFTGFNTLNQEVVVPPGATLTVITELTVKP